MPRLVALIAILVAITCRGWLHFSTNLVPGMNGGYYLVQARSLLEKGTLGIPDLPLVFTLQACLAQVIHLFSFLDLNHSIMLAVKVADSVLPSLAIIPIMLLGVVWSRGGKIDLLLAAIMGLAVMAGPAALSMVGEFEKNSLGLALLCTLAWAMRRWGQAPSRGKALTAAGVLGLIGITHIGVFGTALIFAGGTFLALAMADGREGVKRVARLLVIAIPLVLVAGALVYWKFDPSRIHKLLHAFSEPADYLSGGMPGPIGPGGNMPGGPPSNVTQWLPGLLFALVVISAVIVAWFRRTPENRATVAVITGAALTVVALTGPWVLGDKVMRFYLNAIPLALLCLLYLGLSIRPVIGRTVFGILLLGTLVATSGPRLMAGGKPIITEEAQAELRALAVSVDEPAQTLIVARHGLEWWTAWTLHTHIAQAQALTAEDWKKFKYVWFIEQKKGMGQPSMMGGPMGFGGPPRGPGGPGVRRRGPEGEKGEPPPDFMRPPMNGGPGGGRGPMFGGMMGAAIPDDAEILHNGEFFKLAWVKQPPAFVLERETVPLDPFANWDAITK